MPLTGYGVLKAGAQQRRLATSSSPHYQLLCEAAGEPFRIAVNARSQTAPSEVEYAVVSPFAHPIAARVDALADGWHALAPGADTGGLDLIRGNLAQPSAFQPLPLSQAGPGNDLNDLFDFHLQALLGDAAARVFAFGQRWDDNAADPYFGFKPGRGVHDIHQNQGNSGQFTGDDGVWQDGGLLLHAGGVWTAILLRFQSQTWHTDDQTGHTLPDGAPAPPLATDPDLRIVAAAVNPPGPAPEHEYVIVLNTTWQAVDLHGWTLATATGSAPLDATVPAGGTLALTAAVPLSNSKGGTLSLLDAGGRKVHGVAYTAAQAKREDRLIVF